MSRCPVSRTKLLVITGLPVVTADTAAVADELSPEIVSEVVNVLSFVETNDIGLVVSIILAVAPLEEPVIFSPLVNAPVIVPSVSSGAEALVELS